MLRALVICLVLHASVASQPGSINHQDFNESTEYHSSDWPLAVELNRHEAFVRNSITIIAHLNQSEETIQTLVPGSSKSDTKHPYIIACNFGRQCQQWMRWAKAVFTDRDWQPWPPFLCLTEFPTEDETLFKAIDDRQRMLQDLAPNLAKRAGIDWQRASAVWREKYETRNRQCEINVVGAARRYHHWYLLTRVTNEPMVQHMPLWERQYIVEYIRLYENKQLYTGPIWESNLTRADGTKVEGGTTALQKMVGQATASAFGVTFAENNPAIDEAMGRSEVYTEQAEDAMTPSNIAILALPLALNLVPVGLVADVTTLRMLSYVLLSNVITVLPLGIKGVELIFLAGGRVRTVVTRITNKATGEDLALGAVAEVWAAECRARESVRRTGAVFIVLAVLFLVIGVGGELWAWRWVGRRRRERIWWQKQVLGGGVLQKSVRDDGAEMFEEEMWTEKDA